MFIIAVYLIFSMLAVIWFDVGSFKIPNWLVGSLLILYPVAVMILIKMMHKQVDWHMALLGMGIVFTVGYVFFALKWMGGGDIKLLTVLTLWVGLGNLMSFIFIVSLFGGVFALGVLMLRKVRPHLPHLPMLKTASGEIPRILRDGEPVPYGVAIAFGFMTMLWLGFVPVIK